MRLIVVDDDRLVVDSLKIILGAQTQIEVVGTGADGNDAVALYAELAPDIALLDIQMPGRDGLSAAREILEHDPAARVVFLTTFWPKHPLLLPRNGWQSASIQTWGPTFLLP